MGKTKTLEQVKTCCQHEVQGRPCKWPAKDGEKFCGRHLGSTTQKGETRIVQYKKPKDKVSKKESKDSKALVPQKGPKGAKKIVRSRTSKIRKDAKGNVIYTEEIMRETIYLDFIDLTL